MYLNLHEKNPPIVDFTVLTVTSNTQVRNR